MIYGWVVPCIQCMYFSSYALPRYFIECTLSVCKFATYSPPSIKCNLWNHQYILIQLSFSNHIELGGAQNYKMNSKVELCHHLCTLFFICGTLPSNNITIWLTTKPSRNWRVGLESFHHNYDITTFCDIQQKASTSWHLWMSFSLLTKNFWLLLWPNFWKIRKTLQK